MSLYIWKLENVRKDFQYEMYSSCIVVSESEEKAKRIHPNNKMYHHYYDSEINEWFGIDIKGNRYECGSDWAGYIDNVKITKIGIADPSFKEGEVICASFIAG